TIASAVTLTAHSRFGQRLLPYDNADTMRKKLRNFRFHLDRRTGAIVATEYAEDLESGGQKSLDDPTRALLGGHSFSIGLGEEIAKGVGSMAVSRGLSTNLGSGDRRPAYEIKKVVRSDNATRADLGGGLSRTKSLKYFPSQEIPRVLQPAGATRSVSREHSRSSSVNSQHIPSILQPNRFGTSNA
ncbi:hypothetical protein C8J56DRAFT_788005, partial [Mycena floridula]